MHKSNKLLINIIGQYYFIINLKIIYSAINIDKIFLNKDSMQVKLLKSRSNSISSDIQTVSDE